jgi:hypothetical protein
MHTCTRAPAIAYAAPVMSQSEPIRANQSQSEPIRANQSQSWRGRSDVIHGNPLADVINGNQACSRGVKLKWSCGVKAIKHAHAV